jgi:hypothetical protein
MQMLLQIASWVTKISEFSVGLIPSMPVLFCLWPEQWMRPFCCGRKLAKVVMNYVNRRLTDVGKVVSLTYRSPFIPPTPRKFPLYIFLFVAESTPRGIVHLEGLGQLKKFTRTWTLNLPACSILPQPTTLTFNIVYKCKILKFTIPLWVW